MRSQRIYHRLLVLVALLALGLGVAGYAGDALRRADLGSIDARFDLRGAQPSPRDVLLVKIDEPTFDELDDRFPLRRRYYAEAIDRLKAAGARTIAVDVQFTEPSASVGDDNLLIEAVRAARPVVLASSQISEQGTTAIFGGGEGLEYSRAIPSHVLLPNDPGAIVRRMSLRERGLRSFPVAAAEAYLGRPVRVPAGRVPTPWIDFRGGPGRVESVSLSDVVEGRFDRAAARGRIVVIGATALSLQDRQPTSTTDDEDMPGPEILANAIDTVLRGFPLRTGPPLVDLLLIALGALTAPLGTMRWGIKRGLIVTGVVLLASAGAVQLAFGAGIIVSFIYAMAAALVATAATIVLHGLTAVFEREQVRSTFARFVPESVVGEVLSCADGARLGGVRRECTLLFSDLRGFTSFSENRQPSLVIDVLNRYLSEMSDAILDNGGTLVSYMGDGIMAVFGAPLDQPDHADRAVQASVDMLDRMRGFNAWMREQGHGDGFKMGVGLNTGPVMAGNVGSERRLEYTTIGDVTNTAARIEGMTKGTPHQLFLSESTRLAMQHDRELTAVGDFEVRGRTHPITLWTVPGTDAEPAPTGREEAVRAGVGLAPNEGQRQGLLLRRAGRAAVRLRHRRHLRRAAVHQGGLRPVAVSRGRGGLVAAARGDARRGAGRSVVGHARAAQAHHRRRRDLRRRRARGGTRAEHRRPARGAVRARHRGRLGRARRPALPVGDRADRDPRRGRLAQPAHDRRRHPHRLHRQRGARVDRGVADHGRAGRRARGRAARRDGVHARDAAVPRARRPGGRGARGARGAARGGRGRAGARRDPRGRGGRGRHDAARAARTLGPAALLVAIGLAVFQQLIGINTIIYYAPTTLTNVGYGNAGAIYANLAIGVLNVVMTVVAIRIVDRVGRKPMLIGGLLGMIASLAVLGGSLLALAEPKSPGDPAAIITLVCLATFIGAFALTWGPVVWVMLPEILPLSVRGAAMGVAIFLHWFANFVVSQTFPVALDAFGPGPVFLGYAAIALLALAFVAKFVTETKGRSLEAIEGDLQEATGVR